jgi:ubiquinone/menaquinone biosynthesis C-methylase UbiE
MVKTCYLDFYEKWYSDVKRISVILWDVGHILRRKEIKPFVEQLQGKIILDVGCGLGDILLAFNPDNTFIGIYVSLNAF